MNTKRILFWLSFVVILGLIVWGLVVAMNKAPTDGPELDAPAPVTASDHVMGPDSAPVTLIEYGDFQCPACAAYHPLVKQLMAEASTTMRFVYRHFPLPGHKNARVASQAAEAASEQGKFWEMYDILFETQKDWETLSPVEVLAQFKEYATELELDLVAYETAFNSAEAKAKIDADQVDGTDIGVRGTPTFFVNGAVVQNIQSYADFKNLITTAASSTPN